MPQELEAALTAAREEAGRNLERAQDAEAAVAAATAAAAAAAEDTSHVSRELKASEEAWAGPFILGLRFFVACMLGISLLPRGLIGAAAAARPPAA